ncbi:hypothetical protein EIP86_000460 [Pleurotus ostreatoroseus]|nr:hypothetical protein EIP86_000460 [Pleurotus ostreatoroseus]
MPTSDVSRRKTKRRQAAVFTDDEDEEQGVAATSEVVRSTKRARTDERSVGGASAGDVDVEEDADESKFGHDDEDDDEDTRFLPPTAKRKVAKAKGKASRKSVAGNKKRRTVVLSDDEAGGDYREEDDPGAEDDDDFSPEPSVRKGVGMGTKIKGKGSRIGSKGPVDKDIIIAKDERRSIPPTIGLPPKRALEEEDPIDVESVAKEPTPPPLKKRKLPTIKKNKPSAGSTASSTPSTSKPVPKPEASAAGSSGNGTGTDAFALGQRKTAANLGNADFDLRDASVYAQLFTKPGGSTPNSGLNRKEKEEERKKELNKMREEARAKRAEEAQKTSFDLQAAAEKIARFEERLQARKSMAVYPNILGAAFKETYARTLKRRERERESSCLRS